MAAVFAHRSMRLVVIDSDQRTRSYVKRWLGEKGVRVIGEADDAKSGLRLVRGLQPDVVLLELPASASDTMDILKKIREEFPSIGIILSSHETSHQLILSCIRAGAQEFVARPIDAAELEKAIQHVRSLLERMGTTEKKRGTVLSVFSSKGGTGVTTAVANLGVALAERPDTRVIVVDLSFHMGDLGIMLDLPPRYSLPDAFEDGALEESKLRTIFSQHSSGLHLLTVASGPEVAEEVTRQHMVELFGMLNTMFDFTIVDVGRHLDDRTVEVLELSDGVLVMSGLDLPTIRNVSRYLDIFDRLNMDREKLHLVVNRFHKKTRLNLKDLEATVGMQTFWTIPNDYEPVSLGIDAGIPAVMQSPKTKVAQSFKDLAQYLCETYGRPTASETVEMTTSNS